MRSVDLSIEGMTCASCVRKIEKRLQRIEGVEASVNLPLESARLRVPEAVSDQALLEAVSNAGYQASVQSGETGRGQPADGESATGEKVTRSFIWRLIIAAILSTPVLLISMIPALQFPHWGWWIAALTLPVVTWCAESFHRSALSGARHLSASMDTLVSIGIAVAYLFSLAQLLIAPNLTEHPGGHGGQGHAQLYFEVSAVIVTFLLLGRYLETRAKSHTGDALRSLLNLSAQEASVLRNGAQGQVEERIPADQLLVGDRFVVRPGEKIAADGVIADGRSSVDTSLITGESMPVEVGPGDQVTGATINSSGRLVVEALRVGADTTLAQMARLVSQAQTGKAPIARLADRISAVFVPIVLLIAIATFTLWWLIGNDLQTALLASVAVLIIACPCALGLATPVALVSGTGRGAELGILIKGPETLEETRRVDTIILDKTGTVTTGQLTLTQTRPLTGTGSSGIENAGPRPEAELLRLAAALEQGSEHPVATALIQAHQNQTGSLGGSTLPAVTDFRSHPGGGIVGAIEGRQLLAGTRAFLETEGITVPGDAPQALPGTSVWLAADGLLLGEMRFTDEVKASSPAAVQELRRLGLRPLLVTGDNELTAQAAAQAIGIDAGDVYAQMPPEGKVAVVEQLQAEGRIVAMAGDGVNDAAALAQADLGIAMGSGTDVAIEAADLTVMGEDLRQIPTAIRLSRATLRTIKGNLFWAFAYNVVGIPIAALGLLNPMIAGAAMAASSVLVVLNSLRLRRFR
ncbi:heavy metal translocating P-type ATPase [Acaricomes phytoseiuli]|uniref:heavy metal translocating P-type ATPase n=1 Tax=Acaricomes phytoseiuli TaxID=291968 RepID=UPI00036CD073|nr:heavy metal translocating P-type ATPase [Acaricomes phytoseiuli]MCW1248624.1 heavy metal translocating P-type ATPase [Acaricomes phytoseiuli]